MIPAYTDYRFKAASLADIQAALAALRAAGVLSATLGPEDMLGDVQADAQGRPVLRARQGRAAFSYADEVTGATVNVPACGDPALWYVAIRSSVPPSAIVIDPAAFGLTACDPATSALVLGCWV
jgi:hypothetical protein